jgi:hypothetical protein
MRRNKTKPANLETAQGHGTVEANLTICTATRSEKAKSVVHVAVNAANECSAALFATT